MASCGAITRVASSRLRLPTVVTVTRHHHIASGMDWKVLGLPAQAQGRGCKRELC